MSKVKYPLNEIFDADSIFAETLLEFRDYPRQNEVTINEMPLKFLLCFTAGVADAAYYLACCLMSSRGVLNDRAEDLVTLMYNVAALTSDKNKQIACAMIKDVKPASWIPIRASEIALWFREGKEYNHEYTYEEILSAIFEFDNILKQSCSLSLLKTINDSDLKNDFSVIDGASEYLGLTFKKGARVKSDETTMSTVFENSDNGDAHYEGFASARVSEDIEVKVDIAGEDNANMLCGSCIIS